MKILLVLTSIVFAGSATAFYVAGALPGPANPAPYGSASGAAIDSPRIVRAIGYVEPVSEIRKLTFKADGVIDMCRVQVGQQVEAGDILASLGCRDEQAAVAVAEQELAVTRAERDKLLSGIHPKQIEAAERRIAKIEEKARHAQKHYDRQKTLRVKNAISATDFDLAETDLRQATEELKEASADLIELQTHVRAEDRALAESKVHLAEANVAAAKERLQNTILTAPIRGTVLEVLKREGEAVRAFDPQPAIVFADLSQVRVRAEVDERYVHVLRAGQDVVIYGRGLGDCRLPATLALIKPLMGSKTVFSRDASERKDLDVLQIFVRPRKPLSAPIGLQVDLDIAVTESPADPVRNPPMPRSDRRSSSEQ